MKVNNGGLSPVLVGGQAGSPEQGTEKLRLQMMAVSGRHEKLAGKECFKLPA